MNEAPPAASADAGDAHASNDRLKRLAAIASVAVAATLILAKAGAYMATGSISLLSTLVDSFLDLLASLINLVAIRQAAQPADREHRFGHGKAEPLAGLGQAAFVGGSAVFLIVQAGERLMRPEPLANEAIGIGVMVLSIVLTFGLVLFQRWVIRKTKSVAIGADSLHYTSDLLVNLGVIGALVVVAHTGWLKADPIVAIVVSLYIVWSAWEILRGSMNLLMDRELPDEERRRIREIATANPGVRDVHDLRTRSSGTQSFIQFHLEMDGGLSLVEAHAIADSVMQDIERAFPDAEVLIHEDPHGVDERRASFE